VWLDHLLSRDLRIVSAISSLLHSLVLYRIQKRKANSEKHGAQPREIFEDYLKNSLVAQLVRALH